MILVLDNYDSFVYTLVGYVNRLGVSTRVFRNDAFTESDMLALLDDFDGVLISPGPGTPSQAGLSKTVIQACADRALPLLGVCLGHQALAETFGATVAIAPELMHGKISTINQDGTSRIFAGLPHSFKATRYHSLAIVDETMPDELRVTARTPSGIIMAIEHAKLPLYGVQFHPESFQTEHGATIISNWLGTIN